MEAKKVIALGIVLLLVVNLILFAARRVSVTTFWLIIGLGAVVAFMQRRWDGWMDG